MARSSLARVALPAALFAALLLAAAQAVHADSAKELELKVDAALERFYEEVPGGERFADEAAGLLVFPSVLKAGFGIGGEYGEGALRVGGETAAYYSTASASIGFQLGAQSKTVVLAFLEQAALDAFQRSKGWEAGVDGSIAVVELGTGERLTTADFDEPIVGFVLTLEGSKYTRLEK